MKKIPVFLVLVLLAALPASAQARGALDPSFGEGGRVVRELPSDKIFGPTQVQQGPDGTVYAFYRGSLAAFRPNGETDPSFGSNGVLPLLDRIPFGFGARLAIDSRGRLILAGNVAVHEYGYANPVVEDRLLAVTRLLPDGAPDPAFNGGKVLVTDLGLPEAIPPASAPPSLRGGVSLQVAGLAVDGADRILITGERTKSYSVTKNGLLGLTEGIVTRLAADGSQDRSYAADGVARGFSPLGVTTSTAAPDGSLYVLSPMPSNGMVAIGSVVHLSPNGVLDHGFAQNGELRLRYDNEATMAVDGAGRLTVALPRMNGTSMETTLTRFRRDGRPATGFGERGSVRLRFAQATFFGIHIAGDHGGGIFLGTTSTPAGRWRGLQKGFLLAHVTRAGEVDRRFGRRETRFGATTKAALESLSVDRKGRPLLAGGIISPLLPTRRGLAIARYRPATPPA